MLNAAGYYFAPGSGSGQNLWIVYLEGGFWCFDETSCNTRFENAKFDMSSDGWKTEIAQGGILGTSPENPWNNANKAWIKYCSSDSWFGDAPASDATWGYAFRGRTIIDTTFQALVQSHGLGKQSGAQVLFGGCSAGGRGVLAALDGVAGQMPAGVTVKGLIDAAAWVDIAPPDANLVSLQEMTQDITSFASPPIPVNCANDYQGEEWKCLWGSYRLPYLATPYFLNAAQFDAFQIMYDLLNGMPSTPAQQQWADQFQSQTLNLFGQLNPAVASVFSSTCLVHCLSSATDYFTFTVNGITMADAMKAWYFDGTGRDIISPCQGFQCTQSCSGGPWDPSNVPEAVAMQQDEAAAAQSVGGPPDKYVAGSEPDPYKAGSGPDPYKPVAGASAAQGPNGGAVPGTPLTQADNVAWAQQQARTLRAHAVVCVSAETHPRSAPAPPSDAPRGASGGAGVAERPRAAGAGCAGASGDIAGGSAEG